MGFWISFAALLLAEVAAAIWFGAGLSTVADGGTPIPVDRLLMLISALASVIGVVYYEVRKASDADNKVNQSGNVVGGDMSAGNMSKSTRKKNRTRP